MEDVSAMKVQNNNRVPRMVLSTDISLTDMETLLIQRAFHDYAEVHVEKEFGGGFGGARVFLILPVRANGLYDARVVTKIGPAEDLLHEFENYKNYVESVLPFTAAQVREPYVQDGLAALNYVFVGGADLGKSLSLEDYYHSYPAKEVIITLQNLLGKAVGSMWYGQSSSLTCRFRDEYGHHLPSHQELEEIVHKIFPKAVTLDGSQVNIPGVSRTYQYPLAVYPHLLDKVLEGRKSLVHGDLHGRNVLVDERGKGWLIDFAKVGERHNLFDFIKLEVYVRLLALAKEYGAFSLREYVQFEQALNTSVIKENSIPLTNPELVKAYEVMQAIRQMARSYMRGPESFHSEYLTPLFLYCLAIMKYLPYNGAVPTQLVFLTACVTGQYLEGEPVLPPIIKQPVDKVKLLELITRYFDLPDLQTLCAHIERDLHRDRKLDVEKKFDLGTFGGDNIDDRAVKMIRWLDNRSLLVYLVNAVYRMRPELIELSE
jgi:hypothetical protein